MYYIESNILLKIRTYLFKCKTKYKVIFKKHDLLLILCLEKEELIKIKIFIHIENVEYVYLHI